jgi:hypothetical protein
MPQMPIVSLPPRAACVRCTSPLAEQYRMHETQLDVWLRVSSVRHDTVQGEPRRVSEISHVDNHDESNHAS